MTFNYVYRDNLRFVKKINKNGSKKTKIKRCDFKKKKVWSIDVSYKYMEIIFKT